YEMLAGRRAFQGETSVETMTAILKQEPPEIAGERGAPLALERIVRHCLEKNPAERFQSARDLAFHLEALTDSSGPAMLTPATTRARRPVLVVVAALIGGVALALLGARALRERPLPSFKPLTFRYGHVPRARFAPDGRTIVYEASWEGRPSELFSTRIDGLESRALGIEGRLESVSSNEELAILHGWTLARVPLAGGAPRDVLDNVWSADWAPDGESLAVSRFVDGRWRIEFPVGKLLYESDSSLEKVRVSPGGDAVAFEESGDRQDGKGNDLVVVETTGRARKLARIAPFGLTWSPRGDEVLYADDFGLGSVSRSGKQRVLAHFPGFVKLKDASRDGRVLVERASDRVVIMARLEGDHRERNLSWHDASDLADLSADGRQLLFNETQWAGGSHGAIYLRPTDGSPAVRLGEGFAHALSPDGRWVLASSNGPPIEIVLWPTGAGEPRRFAIDHGGAFQGGSWLPDSRGIVFSTWVPEEGARLYEQSLDGGGPRPLSDPDDDLRFPIVSPDGRLAAALKPGHGIWIKPLQGGQPRALLPEAGERVVPIRWSSDSRSVYVHDRDASRPVTEVFAVGIDGSRRVVREIAIPDRAGVVGDVTVAMSPNARAYAYSFVRIISELYLVEGLR
ncbi:MAG: hypothetical protein L0206_11235, partial [Actinobacteria bacterium]|nr:hypothetical protein [Actinomycetota bacterium]